MFDADKKEFAKIVRATMMVCGGEAPETDVLRIWWASLHNYDIANVSAAFSEYAMRGKFAPKPADILGILDRLLPDGRPGADEAWAMIPKDEQSSVVMTEEMAEALGIARPLLNDGDKIAARMAFKEAYTRIVGANKTAGIKPKWFPSLGIDMTGRDLVIAEAVRLGRLSANHAIGLTAPDNVQVMLENAGEINLALEYKPDDTAKARENLERLRSMLGMASAEGAA